MFDFGGVGDDALIDDLRGCEDAVRAAQARQFALIAELRRRAGSWILPDGDRFIAAVDLAAAEIGPVLRLTRHAAVDRVALSDALTSRLPATLAALGSGELDLTRVRVIAAATDVLTAEQAATVEARVLPRAGSQTAPALRESCARAVIAVDPAAAEHRHKQAHRDRAARLYPAEDGMATLWARLAATDAIAAFESLRRAADAATTSDDDRTADARRADTLHDLLLAADPEHTTAEAYADSRGDNDTTTGTTDSADSAGTAGAGAAPTAGVDPAPAPTAPSAVRRCRCATAKPARPSRSGRAAVHVTVAWTTLAGLDDNPAHLRGHGPITAPAARLIAGDATWRRILTDPHSGTVLDVGRTTYTPPAALAEHVRTRDRHCRFPGCRQPAGLDLDHTEPYPSGPTADCNLAALCRGHHLIKTHTDWQVQQRWEGTLLWTSPTRQRHPTEPQPADQHPPHAQPDDPCSPPLEPDEPDDDQWEIAAGES